MPCVVLFLLFGFLAIQIKHVVLQMAGYVSPDLREWVETHTTFPNTMVDRITPMTEAEHIELMARYVLRAIPYVGPICVLASCVDSREAESAVAEM